MFVRPGLGLCNASLWARVEGKVEIASLERLKLKAVKKHLGSVWMMRFSKIVISQNCSFINKETQNRGLEKRGYEWSF